ncbi:SBP (S-ribonuclease binding protein) family protein [Forsythia ovata]|uniref:SBP (S-ribonuclease binding protein) family protein n=1 Tax=Forsythia ovata TaxID=205694 RepID=A0ABD1R327_9LAMI
MFGGGSNGNTMFPVSEEENRVGYDGNSLPQFKLFGHVPIDSGVDVTNTMYNELALAANRPIKRVREADPVCRQKGIQISMNNNFRSNDVGHIGTLLNPNPVSTGLRLSCQEERNSSVFSADENMRNTLPGILSLGNSVKLELDRQRAEFDHYTNRQEENLQKGVRELNQRQIVCILNALEGGVKTKLQEKQNEIENINRKNKELGDRIKQVVYEAQSWRHRAKYNESVANLLKSNIQQLMAQGTARAQEGSGESEVDDAVSSMNHHGIVSGSGKQVPLDHQLNCRACKGKEVSVLLFPCRHFCLCIDCEGLINICPICQVMKTASLQVYMS